MSSAYIDNVLLNAAGLSEFPELYAYIHEREHKPIVDGIANQIIVGPQYLQDQVKDNDDKFDVYPAPQPITPIEIPQDQIFKIPKNQFAAKQQVNNLDLCDFCGSYLIDPQPQESNQNYITSNGQPISHIDSVIMQHDTLPSVPIPPSVFRFYTVAEVSRDQLLALANTPYDLDAFKIYIIDDIVNKLVMFSIYLRQKLFVETKHIYPIQDIPSTYLTVGDTDNPVR
ncbi:MAG: hypothetical protein EZS28_022481 [Streblomastix strix]|uniref:Uncharacterized protein n=1 Tax=Streblomastix strix TaxID=222440 RepID=A0A5J4VI97_9EUKA|nr:MAG: hypothetical protein EZS28_022481 [Streblomastix strix]